jgi:hypothetical protein
MKIYIYKSNGNIYKVEDNRFVQNGSGDLAVNQIKFSFVDDTGAVIAWPDVKWVKLACKRQDGLTIRPLNIGYNSTEKAWIYTITDTSGILGLQGSLEISALFVAADLVNSGTGTVWKNERVLASVAVLGKVLRNVNYDGETWSNDIQRLEEGIDGLQGQIVQTNAELDTANNKIDANTVGLSQAQTAIDGLENRTNTLEQDVADLKRDITGVYQFKGSVNTYADLLTKSATAEIGDVWEVIHPDGINYAWVGESTEHPDGWDSLGQVFKLSPATYNSLGGVIPDGNTMEVNEKGVIKPRAATNQKAGIILPDGETVLIKNGKLSTNPNTDDRAYIQSLFDLYFKSVDYVFAGINPELELLENPVQVVIGSEGEGYVNLDYPLDFIEGKNYHIKATIGKLDGSVEEYERDIKAQRIDIDQPICLLDYSDQKIIYVIDKAKSTPTGGTEADENASTVIAGDNGETKVWSYVTFTSIVQKEVNTNLLTEPIVVTQEEIDAGGSRGVEKTLNKAIGLEIDKIYDLTIVQNGVETIVTAGTIDGKANSGSTFSFPVITTSTWLPDSPIMIAVYDGVDVSSGEPVQADKAMIGFSPYDIVGAFELTSIKEHANLEDWTVPLVVTIDNPKKVPYDKYYKKTGSLFTSAGQTVKVTGSITIDGQAKPFEVEDTTLGDTGAYYVNYNITELDQSFTIADGAFSSSLGGAFPASYMTLEIDNSYSDGSPMSELRIDSITVT